MAVQTRPYFVTYKGIQHMVEATQPAAAVQHVVGEAITELRAAKGGEVTAWMRAGKELEIAGRTPGTLPTEAPKAGEEEPKWHAGDCAIWIEGQEGDVAAALEIWKKIVVEAHMALEDFDSMREAIPVFGEAMLGDGTGKIEGEPATVDGIRASLEEQPMPLWGVVELIGERKRWELYGDKDPAALNEQAVVESE